MSHVLLQHVFSESELNLFLEVFLRMARECFGERLQSVILHGSLLFDDLAPGYGDLDFVGIVDCDF